MTKNQCLNAYSYLTNDITKYGDDYWMLNTLTENGINQALIRQFGSGRGDDNPLIVDNINTRLKYGDYPGRKKAWIAFTNFVRYQGSKFSFRNKNTVRNRKSVGKPKSKAQKSSPSKSKAQNRTPKGNSKRRSRKTSKRRSRASSKRRSRN